MLMKGIKISLKKKKKRHIIANTMKIFLKTKNKGQQNVEELFI